MKKLAALILLVLIAALLVGCSLTSSNSNTGPCTAQNLTMGPSNFCTTALSLPKGSTITFVDEPDNGAIHILVIGTNGNSDTESGAPDFGGTAGHSMNAGDTWTSPPWNKAGTYHVTCTVHPQTMNLTVTVTG